MHFDQVCYDFPELRIVMRHGAEPWEDLAVKLMLKWPGPLLHDVGLRPQVLPEGHRRLRQHPGCRQDHVRRLLPDGPTLDRIFTEMPNVPFRDHVWPLFLRENAMTGVQAGVDGRDRRTRRIPYAGSVHDEREVEAVVEVLRGGPQALRIGKNVREFERGLPSLFGKRRGIMCNSGSSALYLAIELLDLAPGDEVITSAVTFSTDIAPLVRAGVTPGICRRRARHL